MQEAAVFFPTLAHGRVFALFETQLVEKIKRKKEKKK